MPTSMVWNGMQEYIAELRKLPTACKGEAKKLIDGEVNSAYVTIKQVYLAHKVTGTLAKRLTITPSASGATLTSGSPIAWLFDNGSQARHWGGGKSTGKMWGKTPPTHIFARTVGKSRRKLAEQYKAMLLRHGATTVTGE